jgi:HAD superfamily hydrolase (TIGR01549 family)
VSEGSGSHGRRWVVLDIGETLIDETRIWSTWADVLGVPRFTLLGVIGGVAAQGGDHRDAFALLGIDDWQAHEPQVQARYGGFRREDLYADALPALRALEQAGLGVAVIGNQPASRTGELRALGIDPDVMAMSDALGVSKPDPAFFTRVLELVGSPPPADVAYVGDRVDNDVVPSASAGLRAVWLRRGPWGYLHRDADGAAALVADSLTDVVAGVGALW